MPDDQPKFILRDAVLPGDYEQIAAVLSATEPDWPKTADDLARFDRNRDPAHYFTRVLAEQNGQVVGMAGIGHDDFSFEAWRYWGNLSVHPDARNQGIGTALYDEIMRRMRSRKARELRTGSSDKPQDAAGRAFLDKRGWKVGWERYESELHTEHIDLHAFDALMNGVAGGGIQLRTLTDQADQQERNRWLHELDWLLFQDVPMGTVLTKKTQEQWVKEELDDPNLRPALSFIALDPSRNDPPNQAMIGMNQQLGFQRTATMYRYELHLDGEP